MAGVKGRSGGRNRKPTAQLKETGGYRKSRHKARADVLVMPVRVPPPDCLGDVGKEAWVRFVNNLPEALITSLDKDGLTQFCQALEAYAKVWPLFINDPIDKDIRITWQAICAQVDRLGRQFGWTPQSRAALSLPAKKEEEESVFSTLLARMSGSN